MSWKYEIDFEEADAMEPLVESTGHILKIRTLTVNSDKAIQGYEEKVVECEYIKGALSAQKPLRNMSVFCMWKDR
jgi:hypothetical protein